MTARATSTAEHADPRYRLTLVSPSANDWWQRYHEIRKAELFDARGRGYVYNPNHPDEKKLGNYPFLLMVSGQGIGVVRLDHLPSPIIKTAAIRLVAITQTEQGRGHGRALHNEVERLALKQGVSLLVVNAAVRAVGFYAKLGYARHVWDDPSKGLDAAFVQMAKLIP